MTETMLLPRKPPSTGNPRVGLAAFFLVAVVVLGAVFLARSQQQRLDEGLLDTEEDLHRAEQQLAPPKKSLSEQARELVKGGWKRHVTADVLKGVTSICLEAALEFALQGDVELSLLWMAKGLCELPQSDEMKPIEETLRMNLSAWTKLLPTPLFPTESVDLATFDQTGRRLFTVHNRRQRMTEFRVGRPQTYDGLPLDESPRQLVCSPDDARLLLVGKKTVRICDTATPFIRSTLTHTGIVNHAVFSPDGRRIATATQEGIVTSWNSEDGKPQYRLQHDAPVSRVVYSGDGKLLLTLSGREVRQWSVETGKISGKPLVSMEPIANLVASHDGSLAAVASQDHTIRVWRIPAGEPLGPPLKLAETARAMSFSLDGRSLIAITPESLRRWTIPEMKVTGPALRPSGRFGMMALSKDASLAALAEKGRIEVRDVMSGNRLAQLSIDQGWVREFGWSDDGRKLLALIESHGQDRARALTWMLPERVPSEKPLPAGTVVEGASMTPDAKTLLTWGAGKMHLWDLDEYRNVSGPIDLNAGTPLVRLSPRGDEIVAAGSGRPQGWDRSGKSIAGYSKLPAGTYSTARFSPTGDAFLLAIDERDSARAMIVHPASGALNRLLKPEGGLGPIKDACFSVDGRKVLTGGAVHDELNRGEAQLWEVDTGRALLPQPLQFDRPVSAVALSPDANHLGIAHGTGVTIWDVRESSRVSRFKLPSGVRALHFAGMNLVIETEGPGGGHLYSLAGEVVGPLPSRKPPVRGQAWIPEIRLVALHDENSIRLVHAESGWPIGPPLNHPARVLSLAVNARSQTLTTVAADGIVRRWPLPTTCDGSPEEIRDSIEKQTERKLDVRNKGGER